MDETEASISKTEAEIKANDGGPEKKAAEAEPEACSEPVEEKEKSDPGPVPEGTEPGFDSIAKPLVEGPTQEARALVENVLPSSTDVSEVEKQLEKMVLVSDPWAALKNLGHSQTHETCETLATSDKNVGESSDAANKPSTCEQTEKTDVDENPRGVKNQVFAGFGSCSAIQTMILYIWRFHMNSLPDLYPYLPTPHLKHGRTAISCSDCRKQGFMDELLWFT